MKICRNCGAKYENDNNFCELCGCPLEEAVMPGNQFPKQPAPKKKSGAGALIAVICVLLVVLGGAGIFTVYKIQEKKIQAVKFEAEKKEKKAKREKKEKEAEHEMKMKEKEAELAKQLEEKDYELEEQLLEKDAELKQAQKELEEEKARARDSYTYVFSSTPEEAFTNYEYTLVDAINSGDYSNAYTVMKVGSSLYNEQKKLVNRLYKKGTSEEVVKCGIKSTENLSSTKVRIISDEIIKVYYADGTQKNLSQCYGYICELTDDGWLLTKIED